MKNRQILISIIASAAAGTAGAQTQFSAAGGLDAYAGSLKNSGDRASRRVVGSGGLSTSWFGFRGKEDLGGGLKAEMALNGFFVIDTGNSGRFAGDTLFSRDANIGLSGSFGKLMLGRASAPSFLPLAQANPFGNSFIFSPLIVHAYSPSGPAGGRNWTGALAGDSGWSNQIQYSSPTLAGWRANFFYQPGEQSGDAGAKNLALNLFYANGPLALSAFAHRVRASNPLPGTVLMDAGKAPVNYASLTLNKALFAGGSYDWGRFKLYGSLQGTENDAGAATVMRDRTWAAGWQAPLGAGALLFHYAHTGRAGTLLGALASSRQSASFGYDYKASKRTDLYLIYMADRVRRRATAASVGLGIRHTY
ncbi:MAG: porin [Pseudomonadota bacterium]